jgi:thiamine biosynthesis lipoprotein
MAPRLVLDTRTLRLILIAFLLLAGLTAHRLFFADLPHGRDVLVIDGETMGTTYQIRIAGGGLTDRLRMRVEEESARRLGEVDDWMSNWNSDSEISRFNRYDKTDGFPVSFETAEVVAFAIELSKWTGGAFDVTVGPLVSLWGFGSGARIDGPPDDDEIRGLMRSIGPRMLRVGRGNPKHGGFLRKGSPETQIDLSAIAKGFGVDHVAAGILELGRTDFLVEIGGEVRASGERPGGGSWRVAVEKPNDEGRSVHWIVDLENLSMATSGDYRIFYRLEDQRVSHTIDPRTGRPVVDGPASATALHSRATVADAWATALMVLGSDGLEFAAANDVAAMLLWRGEDGTIDVERNALFPDSGIAPEAAAANESAPRSVQSLRPMWRPTQKRPFVQRMR